MTLKRIAVAIATAAALGAAAAVTSILILTRAHAEPFVYNYENVLGTSMELKLLANSEASATRARVAVLDEIQRESQILSGYDTTSEFSRWFATRDVAVTVSPELFDVLDQFDRWKDRTGGALDPSAETASRVWKAAAATGHVPSDADLAGAVATIHQAHWRLDAASHTATHLDSAPIVLNSFTKSYIVNRAAAAGMRERGITGIILNVCGDLVAKGNWTERVHVMDPRASADNAPAMDTIAVRDLAVATSGGYRRGFDIAGVHYSHIVDPRTGRPTGHVLSATVVATDAADAGALATAFCVLAPEESEHLAASIPGAEFMMLLADGRRIESAGWRGLSVPPTKTVAAPQPIATLYAADQTPWKPGFELTVAFDIATQPGRANRPYLAIWIEDRDRFPIRTLGVWYREDHSQWLADLKSWYRADRLRNLAEGTDVIGSVTSATRGPGQYSMYWDGKDNAGKLVKAGTYGVCFEIAREHGTYQMMRAEMAFDGVAKKVTLTPNQEVAAATLDYHRVVGK